jgi:hypothetical protein
LLSFATDSASDNSYWYGLEVKINSLSVSQRQQLAQDFVEYYDAVVALDEKMSIYSEVNYGLSVEELSPLVDQTVADHVDQWRSIAEDGGKLSVQDMLYVNSLGKSIIFGGLGLALFVLLFGHYCVVNLVVYVGRRCKSSRRLISIPPGAAGRALFIATMPLGWPLYLVSAILWRIDKRRWRKED